MTDLSALLPGHRLKFLAKDSAIYGLGGALNKALALVTFPILARHFSVADFGVIDLLNTLVVLLVTLLVFGQDSAVARHLYEHGDDDNARRQVISQSFALQLGLLAIVVPAILLLAEPLGALLKSGEDGTQVVRLMVLQAPFFLLINFSQNILKWTFARWRFLFISVGSTVATLAGLLIALSVSTLSVVGLFTIYLAVRATFGLVGLWFVRRWLSMPAGFSQLRRLIPFAVPFGIISAAGSALPVLERNLVVTLVDSQALGLYAAGAKVAMLIGLVINAFETSWGPFALSLFREPDSARTFQAVLKLASVGLCGATLLLTAFGDLVVVVLGSARYEGAGVVVFALTMGLAIQSIGAVTDVGIVFSRKSYLKLYGYGLGLAVAATAIPLLGSRFGIAGVAWGSLCAYAAKAMLEGWLAQRAHRIEWRYAGPFYICALTLLVGLVHQATFERATLLGVRWVPLAALVAMALATWYVFIDADQRRRVLARWKPQ